jgi:hypothetical protein
MVARKSGKAAFQFGFELTNIMPSEGGTETVCGKVPRLNVKLRIAIPANLLFIF